MNRLSYDTLEKIGYDGYLLREAPERVLQFGEGNFLRGFVDRYIDVANETRGFDGKVCVVQPRAAHPAVADALNAQDGLYTVYVRGQVDGVPVETCRVVSAISRILNPHREEDYAALMELAVSDDLELVVSNTTDAGIAWDGSCGPDDRPPASYPAKLAQLLHVRWLAGKPGVTVLPCELIPENGERLLELVTRHAREWGWEDAFVDWLSEGCTFATTLVDSIVPGSVTDPVESAAMDEAAGYEDGFKLVREVFELWGVQGPAALAETLPFADSPSVFVTDDVAPYERRKVRILNGAHTGFALGAYLSGLDIVRDCMHDASVCAFMDGLLEEEVIPTLLSALDRDDCLSFARATKERFDNPFVDHRLISISLNSVAKWRGRVMPTLLDAVEAAGVAPWRLATTLAFLIAFYTSDPTGIDDGGLSLTRPDDTVYHADDAPEVLEFFLAHAGDDAADLVAATLAQEAFWGRDLNDVPGLADRVTEQLALIREQGCRAAMDACATKGASRVAAVIRIDPADNVAVALEPVAAGEAPEGAGGVVALRDVPRGHKMALAPIAAGEDVVKYGVAIGHATRDVAPGDWVHLDAMATNLSGEVDYFFDPRPCTVVPEETRTFMGFRLPDGRAATRNEIWVVPTVGCVNQIARSIAGSVEPRGSVDAVLSFAHPYGCSQTGGDHARTREVLAALAHHPNAAGVVFVSLGCENCTHAQLVEELGDYDPRFVRFLTCQDVDDELAAGTTLVEELMDLVGGREREPIGVDELVVGLKCGGSDGLSGITANPVIGRVSDRVVAEGGTSVLCEAPEMFGAESFLLGRCDSRGTFDDACAMLNGFKEYFISHGETVYENPSPGNKDGGITTLEDKSCGCVQKGGTAPVVAVVPYGGRVERHGLNLLCSPGNDMVSTTALTAAGCHVILFSTGRGTPFGAPAPTMKVATNEALAAAKPGWVDFDAGVVAAGEATIDEAADTLLDAVLACASGRKTSAERRGAAEIAIWKDGVTL